MVQKDGGREGGEKLLKSNLCKPHSHGQAYNYWRFNGMHSPFQLKRPVEQAMLTSILASGDLALPTSIRLS